jgi:hypothetical protein
VRKAVVDANTDTAEISAAGRPRVLVATTWDLDEYVFEAICVGATYFSERGVHRQGFASASQG